MLSMLSMSMLFMLFIFTSKQKINNELSIRYYKYKWRVRTRRSNYVTRIILLNVTEIRTNIKSNKVKNQI